MDGWMDGRMDVGPYVRMDGWMNGWIDGKWMGWIDELVG